MVFTSASHRPDAQDRTDGKHVVCVIDGFDRSLAALRRAVDIAGEQGAALTVVYAETSVLCAVSPMGGVWISDPEALERAIEALISEETSAVPDTRTVIAWDNPAGTVARIVREECAQIVFTPASAGLLSRIARGDITRQLSALTSCPVLPVAA